MKKRITMLLTNSFNPDVRVYKEAVYLLSQGFEVTILCWDKDEATKLSTDEISDGIHVIRFRIPSVAGSGKKQIPAFLHFISACKKYLKAHTCDYLHCHDIDGAIAGYLAAKHNIPRVFDMHEFYERGSQTKKKIWKAITLFLLKHSYAAICVVRKYLEKPYSEACLKIFPLRNYPDCKMIECLPKNECECFRVGYHGMVRGQVPEFKALFEAVKTLNDVRVDINGGGVDLIQLEQLEKQYTNVYVHGPYDGLTESSRLYSQTDVLFCGYNPENPNYQGDTEVVKFYEAIFTGTPMIMTRSIGMGEKVRKYGFGIACDTQNPEEIKKAILKLKEDKDFWIQCSENEKNNATQYDWDNAVKILDEIYKK